MNETKKETCQFKSRSLLHDYKCPEPPLKNSEKGYCIFHEPRKDKDIEKFSEGIRNKFENKDYDFRGYWFPEETTNFGLCTFGIGILADFGGANFKGQANFVGCTFGILADFREATFEELADFGGANFKGNAYFGRATFKGQANFKGSAFKKWADFGGSTFEGQVDFRWRTFEKLANFGGSIFKGQANFRWSTFEGEASFIGCIFKKAIYLDGAAFKIPTGVDRLFRKAKIAWHREGNYVEEGKCHYQEMDYIRKQKRWDIRYIWANLFHRSLHGYGEKPHRVIIWAAVIITTCALLFMNFGIGETRFFGANLPTYNIFKTLFNLYNLSLSDLANIGRYFYFSVVTFTTLGYGDLRPVHPISHLISSIEAFVGMFMMALFVLTFGRKWRR